ncbi:MAG: histidine kinase, partial [Holophaga sp.]|nr:histidine kinase [Holophaga sp.]
MQWNPYIRPFQGAFLRWVPRAILLGGIPSALAQALISGPVPTYLFLSFGVGSVCTLVLWGSYELLSPWILAHPPRLDPGWAAILSLCKWMLVYLLLVGLLLFTAEHLLHLHLSAFFVVTMGLLLSSLVVSVRSTSSQVAMARALEQSSARANLLALKSQLSPHTLFNALNAAASLVSKAPKDAERAIRTRLTPTPIPSSRWTATSASCAAAACAPASTSTARRPSAWYIAASTPTSALARTAPCRTARVSSAAAAYKSAPP